MADIAQLSYSVNSSELAQASRELDKNAEAASKADKAAGGLGRTFDNTGKSAKIAGAAIGGALATGFLMFVKNTMDAEKEQAQLGAALRSTGEAAGYSQQRLNDMANALSKTTALSAGEITNAQTRLLSYSAIVGEEFPRALQLAIDQSVRLGISLTQSAEAVGKALEYPAEGVASLTRQGFRFSDAQKEMLKQLEETGRLAEAQAIVMDVMEESYRGAAEAARNTLGGSLSALKNSLNDLMTGGDGSLQSTTNAVNALTAVLQDPKTKQSIDDIATGLTSIGTAVGPVLMAGLDGAKIGIQAITDLVQGLTTQALGAGDALYRIATLDWSGAKRAIGEMQRGQAQMMASLTFDYAGANANRAVASQQSAYYRSQMASFGATAPTPSGGGGGGTVGGGGSRKKEISEEQSALDRLNESYLSYTERLNRANILFGDNTELARVNYELQHGALKGLEGAERDLLMVAAMRNDAQTAAAEQRQREFYILMDEARELEDVWDAITKEYEKSVGGMDEFAIQAARNMQTHFANFLFDPMQGGFKGMANGFAEALRRMAAEAAASQLFKQLGNWGQANSGAGGWMGMLAGAVGGFGGGKAGGGDTNAGSYYRVGENRPEVYTENGKQYLIPGANGRVSPMSPAKSGGMGSPVVNITLVGAPEGTTATASQNGQGGFDVEVMMGQIKKSVAGDIAQGGVVWNAMKNRGGLRDAV